MAKTNRNYQPTSLLHILIVIVFFVSVFIALTYQHRHIADDRLVKSTLVYSDQDDLIAILTKILNDTNPRAAIEELKAVTEEDPSVLANCHEIIHELGHEAYEKYNSFAVAMSYHDSFCTSGYTHGVIEQLFGEAEDINDLDRSLLTICKDIQDQFLSWECYHGIGHGLMFYFGNNVSTAISYCDKFATYDEQSACANGVFMEHFNYPDQFDNQNQTYSLFDICKVNNYKQDCYINAPIGYLYSTNFDYTNAIEWCEHAEQDSIKDCFQGLGAQATRRKLNDLHFVDSFCNKISFPNNAYCIAGMVSTLQSFDNSLDGIKEMCTKMSSPNDSYCEEAVKSAANQSLTQK